MAINMTNQEMVLTSLGFFKNDYKLDNFHSNFGYDWSDEFENKGCEREMFDCWVNGSLDTHFYFKQTEVNCIDEIEKIA